MSGSALTKALRRLSGLETYSISQPELVSGSARVARSRFSGAVAVGEGCVVDGYTVTANAPVSIGARSILSGPGRIVADIEPVTIGKYCSFAPETLIWESLHRTRRMTTYFAMSELFGESFRSDITSKGPISVGNDVWIGTRAVVLSGVKIGDGAVIGAGSVVTRDIPPYAIAAGSPARVVRMRFPEDVRLRLLDLRWWDWDIETIRRNRALFESDLSFEALDMATR